VCVCEREREGKRERMRDETETGIEGSRHIGKEVIHKKRRKERKGSKVVNGGNEDITKQIEREIKEKVTDKESE
jgi:hypothetical protein